VDGLKARNPQLGNSVQVTTVSLAEIFELAVRQQNNNDALRFYFVPMRQQVETARTVLQQNRQNPENFEGVPLFFLESTQEGGGYLTIQQGNQRVIPVFFTQQDLQAMVNRITQQEPSLAGRTRVQVTSLETLIQVFQSSDDPDLNQVVLVPPRETLEYIRTLQPNGGAAPAGGGRTSGGRTR
jgi:nickel transport protein